jgi:hypothetical protein
MVVSGQLHAQAALPPWKYLPLHTVRERPQGIWTLPGVEPQSEDNIKRDVTGMPCWGTGRSGLVSDLSFRNVRCTSRPAAPLSALPVFAVAHREL